MVAIDAVNEAIWFLLLSNVTVCTYAVGSLLYTMCTKNSKKMVVVVLDILVMELLFSANGATASMGVLDQCGNSPVHWNKVCYVFDRFCHQMGAAFALSLLGSFAFLWLVVLVVLSLHKGSMNSS
ncbi:hypothetical protein K2173_026259 [Erythroxylum novogranatense]|uniref:CASP-like protein n=1 Tax=Erythroxylum novogranatense TaxID=1862640 RepID=A0AAV8SCB2_9ROSI|nr:hypothetical protein K2173_026259 [Erythroxylum novogranatense]